MIQIKTVGPPGNGKPPIYVAEVPLTNEGNFDTEFDVIVFKIMESVKAATDPSGKRRFPKGPTLRERRPHPTKERYSLVTFGWWEMMTVRFTIMALSSDRAAQVTSWFHRMMMRYIFDLSFFKARGVHGRGAKMRWRERFGVAEMDAPNSGSHRFNAGNR